MNGAQWRVQALGMEGVDILVRHEQGAAFAANGHARAGGRVGVCVATPGPGANNLLTGIAERLGIPAVASGALARGGEHPTSGEDLLKPVR